MEWYLFLDDDRFVPFLERFWNQMPALNFDDFFIARSVPEAKQLIEELGWPAFISFDHDLGQPENGKDFANWLIAQDLDNQWMDNLKYGYLVHSQNPVGAENIRLLMSQYLSVRTPCTS